MELSSFKAVLLLKAQGNDNLQFLIKSIHDDHFADAVIEVLEKMPRASANTGSRANGPLTAFGTHASTVDVNMMRDALGHHLSHYKSALKAHHAAPEGTPEKAKARQVADAHMDHLFPLMHLAARAGKHSGNKFDIDYPEIAPWETNYSKLTRNAKNNGPLRDPKLLRVRTKNSGSISKTQPDWHFLETPRHPGHEDKTTMHHASGYPWEEIQLGKPSDIDAKKAHLHIEEIPHKGEFTPHEFDNHPIRGVQDAQNDHLSEARLNQYATDLAGWHGGEHQKNWIARMRALPPGEFATRGSAKAGHFYEGIPLKEHQPHVGEFPNLQALHKEKEAAGAAAAQQAPKGAVTPTVRPTQSAPVAQGQAPTTSPMAVKPVTRPAVQQTIQSAPASAVSPTIASDKKTPEQEHEAAQKTMKMIDSADPKLKEQLMAMPGMKDSFLKYKE